MTLHGYPTAEREHHQEWFELERYFGPDMRWDWCTCLDDKADQEAKVFGNNIEFIEKSQVFIYQGLGLMIAGIHRPYISRILSMTADKGPLSLIDVGSGSGQFGLAMHTLGFRVSFADVWSQSVKFLIWRLKERRLDLPIFVLNDPKTEIPQHNLATCFDVLEHIPGLEEQKKMLDRLGEMAGAVFVNLVRGESHAMHFGLDFEALTKHVLDKWAGAAEDFYPDENGVARQRLLTYGDDIGIGRNGQ